MKLLYRISAPARAVVSMFLLSGCLVGCSGETTVPPADLVNVQGRVTFGGAPVGRTPVIFVPVDEDGTQARGLTDADGRYTLRHESGQLGAEKGDYRVVILSIGRGPGKMRDDLRNQPYADPETTPYRAAVSAEKENATFDFDLKAP